MTENRQTLLKIESQNITFLPEDFCISSSNKAAYEACLEEKIGFPPYENILLIAGPKSSGKSFLSFIISQKLGALSVNSLAELSLDAPIYIIDDAHLLEEKTLFHIFNIASENHKKLILISSNDWEIKLPDLKSRINSVKKVEIGEPGDELIEIILVKEFSKRSLEINREVINYLKTRLNRNFAEIIQNIASIDEYCLKNKKNLSLKAVSGWMKSCNSLEL